MIRLLISVTLVTIVFPFVTHAETYQCVNRNGNTIKLKTDDPSDRAYFRNCVTLSSHLKESYAVYSLQDIQQEQAKGHIKNVECMRFENAVHESGHAGPAYPPCL
jgi:hypothetical protein